MIIANDSVISMIIENTNGGREETNNVTNRMMWKKTIITRNASEMESLQ